MREPKTLAEAWASYEAKVLPRNCSDVQRSETRTGFYSGAAMVFAILTSNVSEGPGEPTDADDALMDNLHNEVKAFMAAKLAEAAALRGRRG